MLIPFTLRQPTFSATSNRFLTASPQVVRFPTLLGRTTAESGDAPVLVGIHHGKAFV